MTSLLTLAALTLFGSDASAQGYSSIAEECLAIFAYDDVWSGSVNVGAQCLTDSPWHQLPGVVIIPGGFDLRGLDDRDLHNCSLFSFTAELCSNIDESEYATDS